LGYELILFDTSLIQKQAVDEIVKYNDITVNYGLVLTEKQAIALTETRSHTLTETGRIEFGGGIIGKIITSFCDSPYISMHNYEETLHELIEMFYCYKNETLDLISDDELIKYMKKSFNGVCQGSLDLLSGRVLYNLARNLRYGYEPFGYDDMNDDVYCGEEDDEDGEY
jgi:hypothetical protein